MNDFVFQNRTKIYFGKDQLTHLGEEAAAFGKKSPPRLWRRFD